MGAHLALSKQCDAPLQGPPRTRRGSIRFAWVALTHPTGLRMSRMILAALTCVAANTGEAIAMPQPIPVLVLAEPASGHGVQPIVPAIVDLLARESGLNLAVRPYPWRRAQLMAERGDGLLYGAAMTPARLHRFRFTSPLGAVNQWLVSASTAPLAFGNWEDLRNRRISIMSGGRFLAEFETRRDVLFSVSESAASMTSRMGMLRAGRVDAVMVASYLNAAQLEEKLNCLFPGAVRLVVKGRPIATEPIMIAVPRSAPLDSVYPALDQAAKRIAALPRLRVEYIRPPGHAPCEGTAALP